MAAVKEPIRTEADLSVTSRLTSVDNFSIGTGISFSEEASELVFDSFSSS